jgi:hypothetical protein
MTTIIYAKSSARQSLALKKDATPATVRHKQNDTNSEQNKQMGCGCLNIGTKQTHDTGGELWRRTTAQDPSDTFHWIIVGRSIIP